MRNVTIISGSKYNQAGLSSVRDLVTKTNDLLETDGVTLKHICLDDVELLLDGKRILLKAGNMDILKSDLVLFRGPISKYARTAYMIGIILSKMKIPFINKSVLNYSGVGKAAQNAIFFMLDFPIPKTYYAEPNIFFDNVDTHFNYPYIVKDIQAAHGNNNFLVKNREELNEIRSDDVLMGRHFVAQQMIENDGDYRILILGNEHMVIHRIGDENSHLNNTSNGGSGVLVTDDELPRGVIEQSYKIAKEFEFTFTGIDVIVDKNSEKYYFLEANSQPQLVAGAEIDVKLKLFADMIINEL